MDEYHLGTSLGRHSDVLAQLGDREPANLIEAQAVIEKIRAEKGYLDSETLQDLQKINEQSRKRILNVVQSGRETEARYTTSISEQLYSSKFRFLYELIQNADDSSYPISTSAWLRFDVTPESFVIETNELGFKRDNVEAICATGRSSKKASVEDDHIGEKGFGFKSVFSIADEVYIQSGWWSFCFKHRKGENGLGMVTPLDAEPNVLPEGVTTRISLKYSEEARHDYHRLVEAVRELPDTTILFLQRLRKIHINILDDTEQYEETTISKQYDLGNRMCTIERHQVSENVNKHEICRYHLFRNTVQNMPLDERRKGRNEARIELAFPFDSITEQPELSEQGQHVFAFLPLQRLAQLQFLIHSDFITSASRENVLDCPWNLKLCEGIADTFVSAVSGTFAKSDHPCKHTWLDWLPKSGMERPWGSLYTSVVRALATKPVAQTWESAQWKAPNQLRIVVPYAVHRGLPILPDLRDEIYLAPGYTTQHVSRLRELEVVDISGDELIDRLQGDLSRSGSRLKTTLATDPWHEAFASLFLQVLETEATTTSRMKQRIRTLGIIPLLNGRQWTGAPGASMGGSQKVYFSYTDQTPIPDLFNLRLLDRSASQNMRRKAFYRALGVEECTRGTVFAKIRERHKTQPQACDTIADLQYLYHQSYELDDLKTWIWAPLTAGWTIQAATKTFYSPTNGEFDMYHLVPSSNRCYLSKALYDIVPPDVFVKKESWHKWLARILPAQSHPMLVGGPSFHKNGHELSQCLQHVLEHNPTKFLGTLRAHWPIYQSRAHLVEKDLRARRVPCMSGTSAPLELAYLPTMDIMNEISRLGIEVDAVNLLNVNERTLDEVTYRSWKFLEDFGVTSRPNLKFYEAAIESKAGRTANVDLNVIADIYLQMVRMTTIEDHRHLRTRFDNSFIWDSHCNEWVERKQCLWNGPEFIRSKSVLSRTYKSFPRLDSFFSAILDVPSTKIEDVIQEIEARRDGEEAVALHLMHQIYMYLHTVAIGDEDWQKIKNAFIEKQLVLGDNGMWYTLSNCLWGSPFALSGMQDLLTIYAEMENLFVRRLKVKRASLSMLITEVKTMTEARQPHVENIKTRLIEIGKTLARNEMDSSVSKALSKLKEVKFLPKILDDGTSVLLGAEEDFAVSDHQRYGDAFASSNALLDFRVHEVQSLHHVFKHMDLTHRYLSSLVKEVSEVGENCIENAVLSRQLQGRAYALYCCAAKHKSSKALHGDRALFEQLTTIRIYTTDCMATNLVLTLGSRPIRVPSKRIAIHSEISEGMIKIYVPNETQHRETCYRSQLPHLLTNILSVDRSATLDIWTIISSNIEDLEDILVQQDIPPVPWIDRPVIVVPYIPEDNRPITPPASHTSSDSETPFPRSRPITPDATPTHHRRAVPILNTGYIAAGTSPPDYPALIEQVVRSAQRAGRMRHNTEDVADQIPFADRAREFDHYATFGSRERDPFAHDRRIGAAGEGYVFELLNCINLPNFSESNWRSTIRGELSCSTRFADIENWIGRETADIVYKDESGQFTQYLREHSEGPFPNQIGEDRNFQTHPIEYFLEVKTTTGDCRTRFYMSSGQYKRMETMALGNFEQCPSKVYVVMRVYNLMSREVGLNIFVDALRFKNTKLNFEAEQWFVNTL
ncbi:hypothetical protein yc1106_02033 [Curvularia clavata]|uniref:Protein NO VEIN C-terminal domain-containing protein n=1 Tax=Curvularia clavata TaxID=95742 RepID=A0A9Q8Z2G9_CURCL|nr:hypothetical protein yc1106_02033 [Curvularia clavata]